MNTRTSQQRLDDLEARGVPCGPIDSIDQVFENPQVQHRDMQISLKHPQHSQLPSVANPIQFSRTPIEYDRAPPTLGQHTQKVLTEVLGYKQADINELKSSGVI